MIWSCGLHHFACGCVSLDGAAYAAHHPEELRIGLHSYSNAYKRWESVQHCGHSTFDAVTMFAGAARSG